MKKHVMKKMSGILAVVMVITCCLTVGCTPAPVPDTDDLSVEEQAQALFDKADAYLLKNAFERKGNNWRAESDEELQAAIKSQDGYMLNDKIVNGQDCLSMTDFPDDGIEHGVVIVDNTVYCVYISNSDDNQQNNGYNDAFTESATEAPAEQSTEIATEYASGDPIQPGMDTSAGLNTGFFSDFKIEVVEPIPPTKVEFSTDHVHVITPETTVALDMGGSMILDANKAYPFEDSEYDDMMEAVFGEQQTEKASYFENIEITKLSGGKTKLVVSGATAEYVEKCRKNDIEVRDVRREYIFDANGRYESVKAYMSVRSSVENGSSYEICLYEEATYTYNNVKVTVPQNADTYPRIEVDWKNKKYE